jgi:hypothetical protein
MRVAEPGEAGTLGVFAEAGFQEHDAELIGRAAGRAHGSLPNLVQAVEDKAGSASADNRPRVDAPAGGDYIARQPWKCMIGPSQIGQVG